MWRMSQSSDCKTIVADFGLVWWIVRGCDASGHIGRYIMLGDW